jgi:HEAT repeat protein
VVVAAAAIAGAIRAEEPRSGAPEKEIKCLVDLLGSEAFNDREEATQQLSKLGKHALPGLREAARSPDAEVRHRARQLIEQIEPPPVPPAGPRQERPLPAPKSYL